MVGSELAPNMFGASSELASVMEFGFNRLSTRFYNRYDNRLYRVNGVLD